MKTRNLTIMCHRVQVAIKHSSRALVTGSWLIAGAALAAPANDDFANAIILAGNSGVQTGTDNVDATSESGETLGHGMTKTVWFKWTCLADGSLTVTTLGSTNATPTEWDAVLGIYTGAAVNALTPLGGSPQDGLVHETMTVAVTAGTTYSIQLGGWGDEAAANILLNWSYAAPPKTVLWNVAGGGDWDLATSNWYTQPSGPVSTFANGDNAIFNNPVGGTINIPSTVSFGTTTVGAASGNYTFSGASLGGSGALTMDGSGTLTLASTNSYSGATVVNTGTLVATGNGALGSSASFSVAPGATLQLNGTNAGGYKWPAAAATLTGAGTVNIPLGNYLNVGSNFNMSTFTGILNLTSANGQFSANPYFSPGFTVPLNGTINIGNNTTMYLGWEGTVYNTTIQLSGGTDNGEGYGVLRGDSATLNGAVILATNSTIGSAGGTLTINSVISDGGNGFGFTTVGGGATVILAAATNTYTGPTIVNSGTTLRCDTPGSLGGGALSINGMVNLNHGGNRNVTSLLLAGTPKAAGVYGSSASAAPPANQDNARFAGTGTVTVVPPVVQKTVLWNVAGGGDWDLATSNWFTQPSGPVSTFVNGDDVIFNNPAGGTINIPSNVSPLTTTVSAASGSYIFSGGSLAAGSLTKSGLGTLTLNSPNTYLGATVVNDGTLVVNGNGAIGNSTSFSVANVATLQLNGTNAGGYDWPANPATLTGAGTVNIPLGNFVNVGNNFDMSAFTGTLNLTSANGMMAVNSFFSPGFTAPLNGTINIGNNTTLYLGWQGTVYNTTIQLSGGTDNGEGYGVLRGDSATLNGAVILATNSTIGSAGGSLTINSVISDGGSGFGFTQVGSGTVTLTAVTNTYTGPTTVNGGATLKCDTSGSLGGGALSINGMVNLNYAGTKTVASLTLSGVPKAAGVYGSSASPAPPANQDDARFSGTGTVTISSDYDMWAAVYLPTDVSDPAGDNDGDGLSNQEEYAFGLNPTLGTSVNPITVPLNKTTGMFTYTRRATPAATGLTYTVQTSTDLSIWPTDVTATATQNVTGTVGDVQTVEVTVTGAPLTAPSLFVRVKATP